MRFFYFNSAFLLLNICLYALQFLRARKGNRRHFRERYSEAKDARRQWLEDLEGSFSAAERRPK